MKTIASQPAPLASFDKIRRVSGFERIRSEYPAYLSDESKLTAGPIEELFFPANEGELAAVLPGLEPVLSAAVYRSRGLWSRLRILIGFWRCATIQVLPNGTSLANAPSACAV